VNMKSSIYWDINSTVWWNSTYVSVERTASLFIVLG
jgi:hypothetical protein